MQKNSQNVVSQSCLFSYQNASESNTKPVLKRSVTNKNLETKSDENTNSKKLESLASKALFASSQTKNFNYSRTNKLDNKS